MTRSRIAVVVIGLITVVVLTTSLAAERKAASLEQWTHQTRAYQTAKAGEMNLDLQKLGLEGWQVASVIAEPRLDNQKPHYVVFLKKRIS